MYWFCAYPQLAVFIVLVILFVGMWVAFYGASSLS